MLGELRWAASELIFLSRESDKDASAWLLCKQLYGFSIESFLECFIPGIFRQVFLVSDLIFKGKKVSEELRAKEYFDQRATQEMEANLRTEKRDVRQSLAYACRILAMTGQEAGLAGQISARSERAGSFWTLRFGLGFDEATPDDFIEVDADLKTVSGSGMANPATRFHLWVYRVRSDVNSIVHTHSPWASALAAAGEPLVISQMDMTPLHDDCAFLAEWPGVPIADQEGAIISEALGTKRAIILAHHGYLTAGRSVEEATYLSVYLERAARMQIRARAFGPLKAVNADLAREAHDYLLKPSIVSGTFDYWCRQTHNALPAPIVR